MLGTTYWWPRFWQFAFFIPIAMPVLGIIRGLARWREVSVLMLLRPTLASSFMFWLPMPLVFITVLPVIALGLAGRPHVLRDVSLALAVAFFGGLTALFLRWQFAVAPLALAAWLMLGVIGLLLERRFSSTDDGKHGSSPVDVGYALLGVAVMVVPVAMSAVGGLWMPLEALSVARQAQVGSQLDDALRVAGFQIFSILLQAYFLFAAIVRPVYRPFVESTAVAPRLPRGLRWAFALAPLPAVVMHESMACLIIVSCASIVIAASGRVRRLDGLAAVLAVFGAVALAFDLGVLPALGWILLAVALSLRGAPRSLSPARVMR
ncbi:MAG: hypothetical protein U0168_18900 [Nannocystaceae bacterium]